MKQLNEERLQTHVPITGWLLIAYGILGVIGGLFAFGLIMSGSVFWTQLRQVGAEANDIDAVHIFGMFNTIIELTAILIGGLVIGLSIPALVAGIGVLARKPWARILGIIAAVFALISFPVGTLIGIYVIIVLMQDAAPHSFASPRVS
jgi:hypothetical protein